MPSKVRLQRIADRLRQDLSEMLVMGRVNDPRLAGVNVTDVSIDRELAYAEIYVSAVEGAERAKEVIAAFEHASGFIRHELAAQIDLRSFPRLRFHWDPTPEKADRIERLLLTLHTDETQAEPEVEDDEVDEA
ncbi:MAG TPA: 30S ribosome-binding factor RbfA [Anaerolineaceae bacterium]|nr:30S ribosome-binding factor RbfA [Anaerolineaceae bacterium]HPN54082.1 30S ribosome-binding factor RbfA [Anaerolineaceae bacterium]